MNSKGEAVQPIKKDEEVRFILETLEEDETRKGKRQFLLFAIGVYTGLRISDILWLRKEDVSGERIEVCERKTGKHQSNDDDYGHSPSFNFSHYTTRQNQRCLRLLRQRTQQNHRF